MFKFSTKKNGLAIIVFLLIPCKIMAKEHFNLNALEIDNPAQSALNVESINQGLEQVPGKYRVSVYVNNQYRFTRDILFTPGEDNKLHPVLSNQDIIDFGVSRDILEKKNASSNSSTELNLQQLLPKATYQADLDNLLLNLNIPQIYIDNSESGTSASLADNGLIAAFAKYDLSGSQTHKNQGMQNTMSDYFIRLQNGINFNSWHLRNAVNLSSGDKKARSQDNYLEKDFPSLQSRLTLGQSYTSSDIFDSMSIRGIQLASQDEMLSDDEQGFSPIIRGLAPSPAKVEVYKNGYSLYQTFVPAGPFELNNLPAEAANGELDVRITDSSGKISHINYNFSSVPVMQRKGAGKYTLAVGKSSDSSGNRQNFVQYTHARGISNELTLYGGILYSAAYRSLLAGLGVNLGSAGALSLDITRALIGDRYVAGGIRSRYYKAFSATDTTLTISNSFFPDKDFTSFEESSVLSKLKSRVEEIGNAARTVSQSQLSLSQPAGAGSLYFSLNDTRYSNKKNNSQSINAGYSFSLMRSNISITISNIRNYFKKNNDRQISLMLQIPFDVLSGSMTAGASIMSSAEQATLITSLSGSAMNMNQLTYNIQKSHSIKDSGGSDSLSMNTAYYSRSALTTLGYTQSDKQKQLNYGLQGAAVIHSGGLTFSQPPGETFGIISTSGIKDIALANSKGVKSDSKGYMIVPNLTPYRKNTLHLIVPSENNTVEVNEPIQTIIPAHGAIQFSSFHVKSGSKALFTLHFKDAYVPFGATVSTEEEMPSTGIVGPDGSVYLSGLKDEGKLTAQWGRSASHICHADYSLALGSDHKRIRIMRKELICA